MQVPDLSPTRFQRGIKIVNRDSRTLGKVQSLPGAATPVRNVGYQHIRAINQLGIAALHTVGGIFLRNVNRLIGIFQNVLVIITLPVAPIRILHKARQEHNKAHVGMRNPKTKHLTCGENIKPDSAPRKEGSHTGAVSISDSSLQQIPKSDKMLTFNFSVSRKGAEFILLITADCLRHRITPKVLTIFVCIVSQKAAFCIALLRTAAFLLSATILASFKEKVNSKFKKAMSKIAKHCHRKHSDISRVPFVFSVSPTVLSAAFFAFYFSLFEKTLDFYTTVCYNAYYYARMRALRRIYFHGRR